MNIPDITLIITNWNGRELLLECRVDKKLIDGKGLQRVVEAIEAIIS